jgi:aspartyl aminopeptidase
VLSPRLDDLSAVWAALSAFICAPVAEGVTPVLAVFDNEEVGSETKQGAASTFLYDTLVRISGGEDEYRRRIASSFMVSADNAHAIHPNHPELSDAENAPVLGGGVVIKYNANQRYTTDAVSDAILRTLAQRADVRIQTYYNRADMPGGSTLGSIADTKVPVATVDIGIPQLAMHSIMETAAAADIGAMYKLLSAFYASSVERDSESGALKVTRA